MTTTTTTKDTYDTYLAEYRALPTLVQRAFRHWASDQLREEGCEEIGSSDVSCRVYDLYRFYGGFIQIVDGLAEEAQ